MNRISWDLTLGFKYVLERGCIDMLHITCLMKADWGAGAAACTPVRTCVLGKECEFIASANIDFYKDPGMRLVT